MVLPDTNALVYAYRKDADDHSAWREWLDSLAESDSAFALSDWVLSGFLRITTHPKVFKEPSSYADALEFVEALRNLSNCVLLAPGPRHWAIFTALCSKTKARGNLIPDAYLAALAIESGSELITADRGFGRFPGLTWRSIA